MRDQLARRNRRAPAMFGSVLSVVIAVDLISRLHVARRIAARTRSRSNRAPARAHVLVGSKKVARSRAARRSVRARARRRRSIMVARRPRCPPTCTTRASRSGRARALRQPRFGSTRSNASSVNAPRADSRGANGRRRPRRAHRPRARRAPSRRRTSKSPSRSSRVERRFARNVGTDSRPLLTSSRANAWCFASASTASRNVRDTGALRA